MFTYILDTRFLSHIWFAVFSPSVSFYFNSIFDAWNWNFNLIWKKSDFSVLCCYCCSCCCAFDVLPKKLLSNPKSWRFISTYPSLRALVFTLSSLIHFRLICVYYMQRCQIHYFACGYPVFSVPFVEKTSFSIEWSWQPCQKSIDHNWQGLFLNTKFDYIDLYVSPYDSPTLYCLQDLCNKFWKQGVCILNFSFFFFQIVLLIWAFFFLLSLFLSFSSFFFFFFFSLNFYLKFQPVNFCKKNSQNWIRIGHDIESVTQFGNNTILSILSLQICEYKFFSFIQMFSYFLQRFVVSE